MGDWISNRDGTSTFGTNSGRSITINNNYLSNGSLIGLSVRDMSKTHHRYHEYSNLTNLGYRVGEVSSLVVTGAFKTNPTPFGHYFAGPGFVSHYSVNSASMVNITTDAHILDPGVVKRELVVINGNYHVRSIGIGVGLLKDLNVTHAKTVWSQADVNIMLQIQKITQVAPNMYQAGVVKEPHCFLAGTPISMWDGTQKPIERVCPDDWVVSYDVNGNLQPGRVKQTFRNEAKIILDFHGTFVTPGHVYYCAGGKYEGRHVPLIDILREDGVIQHENGSLIRASTGCEFGTEEDKEFWAFVVEKGHDGLERIRDKRLLRLGTRWMLPNGAHFSMREYMDGIGIELIESGPHEGYVRFKKTGLVTVFAWTLSEHIPNPEDFILARSQTTLADIYRAGEWEAVRPQMPVPMIMDSGPVQPLTTQEFDGLRKNIPMAFHTDAPPSSLQLNRKARKAEIARQRKIKKTRDRPDKDWNTLH